MAHRYSRARPCGKDEAARRGLRAGSGADCVPLAGTRGAFELSLAPGVYALAAEVDGQLAVKEIELGPGEVLTGLRLELRRQTRIRGRLVDEHGAPLDGHVVALMDGSRARTPEALIRHTVTSPSGEFVLDRLPDAAGEVYLLAGTETTPAAFASAAKLRRLELRREQTVDVGDVTLVSEAGR